MKKIISIFLIAVLISACTDRFERVNKNPFEITEKDLTQDFNFGVGFTNLYRNLVPGGANYQYSTDWAADNYVSYTGTPLDEYGGRDMMSYYFIDNWNNYMWNHYYNNQMSPARVNIISAEENNQPVLKAMAEMIQVMAVSVLTTYYGPVIYSEYGEDKLQFNYDSEQDLYDLLFKKLDELKTVFFNADSAQAVFLKKFDPQYANASTVSATNPANNRPTGNTKLWAKFVNSYKLRLAMRIVKANPGLAEQKFVEAANDPAGLILSTSNAFLNSENFWFRFTGTHPFWTMAASWNDCRMGSEMELVLVGLEDPRIDRYFRNVDTQGNPSNADLSAKFDKTFPDYVFQNPAFRYKGIAPGAYLDNDKVRDCYSSAGLECNILADGFRKRPILLASEVNFLLAEAAVRNWTWTGKKSAQEYYEDGIRASFAEWNVPNAATAANAYLANNTRMPLAEYIDPADKFNRMAGNSNGYMSKMTDPDVYTIQWKEGISDEKKLERIMTQKWIAGFQNAWEVWSDFRRTGYPKITTPSMNNSNSTWGIINTNNGEYIKRMPFVEKERLSNTAGVAEATKKLPNGGNLISTRLWIHPDKANF